MFWVKTRNNQMVPMPASLEHMPAKLRCNLHLHLNLNKDNNCSKLQQLLSMHSLVFGSGFCHFGLCIQAHNVDKQKAIAEKLQKIAEWVCVGHGCQWLVCEGTVNPPPTSTFTPSGGRVSVGGKFGTPKLWCLVYNCRNHSPWETQPGTNGSQDKFAVLRPACCGMLQHASACFGMLEAIGGGYLNFPVNFW